MQFRLKKKTYFFAFAMMLFGIMGCEAVDETGGAATFSTANAPVMAGPQGTPIPTSTLSPSPSPTPRGPLKSVRVTWQPNREKAVNSQNGGYRIYYSKTAGFAIDQAQTVNVPYQSGVQAPTSAVVSGLEAGRYYIKVIGYGTFGVSGSQAPTLGQPAQEVSINVP